LFQPTQVVPLTAPSVAEPAEFEIDPLSQPIYVGARRENMQDMFTSMLRRINLFMARMIKALENEQQTEPTALVPADLKTQGSAKVESGETLKKTALQVINELVKARLTQPEVDVLDDNGVRGQGKISSAEFKLLQERGLKVLKVSIGGLVLNPVIDNTIVSRWSTTWLKIAKAESEQIDRRKNIVESAAKEQAIRQYADMLSRDLVQKKPVGVKETLRTLLLRTRNIIFNNDELRQRMNNEQQELEEIIKWIEVED
jgi:hypothetical protein